MEIRKKITIFSFVGLVLSVGLHALLLYGLRSSNLRDYDMLTALVSGKINADVLFSGSSRALVHFDCRVIAPKLDGATCYNLGLNASPLNYQLPLLQTYFQHNRPPKVLIQGLDLGCLTVERRIADGPKYVPYLWEPYLYNNLLSFDPTFWRHRYIPLYSFAYYGIRLTQKSVRGFFSRFTGGPERHFNGYTPQDLLWTEDFEHFRSANRNGRTYQIEPEGVEALRAIARLCRDSGTDVVFVYSPEYYENFSLTLNRAEIMAAFQNIADEFDVEFWDYSQSALVMDRSNFYNSQHLNQDGATLFSELVGEDLKSYLNRSSNSYSSTANLNSRLRPLHSNGYSD